VEHLLKRAGVTSAFAGDLPYGVTAHSRTDGQRTFVFLQNFTYQTQAVRTTAAYTDYETGDALSGTVTLQPLQTVILVKE
jgi:beta-galactosidase